MLEVNDLTSPTGRSRRSRASPSPSTRARSSRSSAPTAPGKTTTLRTISGLLRPSGGSITFQGKPIHSTAAHDIVALGIAHSPEGRRIFPRLSVEENLILGAFARKDQAQIRTDLHAAYDLFPILGERSKQPAGRSPAVSSRCSPWAAP
jgi:branched-chain amino acid transport system ATP-binding protein